MSGSQFQKPTLTLQQVLEAAKHAEERVASWPAWKRELSFYSSSPSPTRAVESSTDPESTRPKSR